MNGESTPLAVQAALHNLQEIAPPPPTSYTPQTWGWVVLAGVVLTACAWIVHSIVRRHRANRYRHEALAELAAIEAALQHDDTRDRALRALPTLVKRTALASAPRRAVASLTDSAWLQYLDDSMRSTEFTSGPGLWLATLAYGRAEPDEAQRKALVSLIRRWISHHAVV